jgi:serine/threonine-protein kinase
MPIKKIFRSVLRLALVAAAFIAIVIVSFYAVIQVVLRGGEVVEVPNVVNDSFVAAWEKLEEVGLQVAKPSKEHRQYHPVVPQDHIIAQKPMAGSRVKTGRVVRLTISKGLELLAVPDVTREHSNRAEITLKNAGLKVGHDSEIHFPSRKGVVLGQDPRPGASIESGGTVHLLVSAGPRLRKYLIPSVVGLKVNDAIQLLSQLNLDVQQALEVRPRATPGVVLAQDPARNEIIEERASVILTVSTRSRERRWENLRYMVLEFEVPCRLSEQLVRVEMTDALGTETVLRGSFPPCAVVTLPISYKLNADTKEVVVNVLVDGVLRQQTEADITGERTTLFEEPWRDRYGIKDITVAPFRGLR